MHRHGLKAALLLAALAGCAERELILPGERFDVRMPLAETLVPGASDLTLPVNRAMPISLPAPVNHAAWTQTNGSAQHRITHPALRGAVQRVWSASIGAGADRKHRIVATPVAADGRIFTLDSRATLSAHSTGGALLWSRDLTPASDKSDDASGGGLALGGGRLFVTTGFGQMFALDPATGADIWTQQVDAVVAGAPTVADGLVYIVARDARAWAMDAKTGRIHWELLGVPPAAVMVGGSGPAIGDRLAVFPYGTGDMVAALKNSGVRVWAAGVSGQRVGLARGSISDITSDPVIVGNTVFVGNQSGRLAAFDMTDGSRRWTANEGAYGPVWPVGNSIFFISDQLQLIRADSDTGARIWAVDLPAFVKDRPRRQRDVYAHFGPILAGGRLVVTSSDGLMRSFDPVSGALVSTVEIPGGAATAPIVVGGVLYVVSQDGKLHAFQ